MKRLVAIVILLMFAVAGARAYARAYIPPKVYKVQKGTREIPLFDDFKVKARRYYLAYDGDMDMGPRTRCILYNGRKKVAKSYNEIYAIGKAIIYKKFRPTLKPHYQCTEVGFLTREGTPIKIENCISIEELLMNDDTNIGFSYMSDRYFQVFDKQTRSGVADSLGQLIIQYADQSIRAVSRNLIRTNAPNVGYDYYNMRGERVDYTPEDEPWKHICTSRGPHGLCVRHNVDGWEFEYYGYLHPDISWNKGYLGYNNCNYTIRSVFDNQLLYDPQGVPVTDTVYSKVYPVAYNHAIVFKHRKRGECHEGTYGIINVQGEEVVAPKYTFGAVDTMLNVLLNYTCRVRVYPQYDSVIPSDHYDRTMVMRSGKWGVIDHLGNEVLEPLYDSISIGKIRSNFSISVCRDGKWGVADYHGNIVAPTIYDRRPIVSMRNCLMLQRGDRDFALLNNREIVEIKRDGMDIFPLKLYSNPGDE